ncbi:MAG: hypothetical protein EBR41_02485 [Crocinitomicaceae bacterium]|nr:hypothetical protein [Crocinitomicaceae bacterium]
MNALKNKKPCTFVLGSFCDHKGRKIKLLYGSKQAERLADKKVKRFSLHDAKMKISDICRLT